MKNKIIASMILIVLIVPLLSFYSVVQAYNGEIDPEGYITMPSIISIVNNIGTAYFVLWAKIENGTNTYYNFSTYFSEIKQQEETNKPTEENNRKMEVKIGKITDVSILNKLKNQDSTAFADLLKFAKSSQSIYDETLNAEENCSYAIRYDAENGNNKVIKLNGLEGKEYYYLHIKTDDENGKYISNEAVTLAQANLFDNGNWSMMFYESSEFEWADFGNITTEDGVDSSIAPGILPHAGTKETAIGIGIIALSIGVILLCKKIKNIKIYYKKECEPKLLDIKV